MIQTPLETPFLSVHLGDLLALGAFVLAYLDWRGKQKKMVEIQATMHSENQSRLTALEGEQRRSDSLTALQSQQLSQLQQQTAALTEMASGFNRRLEMLEDERRDRGRRSG